MEQIHNIQSIVDSIKDKISSNDYLLLCDGLKSMYKKSTFEGMYIVLVLLPTVYEQHDDNDEGSCSYINIKRIQFITSIKCEASPELVKDLLGGSIIETRQVNEIFTMSPEIKSHFENLAITPACADEIIGQPYTKSFYLESVFVTIKKVDLS